MIESSSFAGTKGRGTDSSAFYPRSAFDGSERQSRTHYVHACCGVELILSKVVRGFPEFISDHIAECVQVSR